MQYRNGKLYTSLQKKEKRKRSKKKRENINKGEVIHIPTGTTRAKAQTALN